MQQQMANVYKNEESFQHFIDKRMSTTTPDKNKKDRQQSVIRNLNK